jgi:hypothetical protein
MDAAPKSLTPAHRWTILRVMVIIACIAPLLALARYPFAFGLFTYAGSVALFVTLSIRHHRYDLVAWLLILYPALPLLIMYVHWNLAIRHIVRRSTPLSDGLIGLSDVGGYLSILAYFGCVMIVGRSLGSPEMRKAAKRVVIFLPITWAALFVFTMWDPFGMLGYFFR